MKITNCVNFDDMMREQKITGHRQGSRFKQTRCTIPTDVRNSIKT